jgi:WD40 repeat protein
MILVVCLPHAVAVFTHWKCVTKDGTRYKRIWAAAFAAYFCAVLSLSLGIMLRTPCKDHNVRAAIIIFTVCLPMILCFALHFVVWSSQNVGSPYPQKYVIRFALVLASVFALSLGLVVGLSSDPLTLRAFSYDRYNVLEDVAWSPDGTKIAAACKSTSGDNGYRQYSSNVYIWSSSAIDPVSGSAFIFAVWTSLILCSILHSVISPVPAKYKCGFLIVALTVSLGLVVGLSVPKIFLANQANVYGTVGDYGIIHSLAWSPDGSKIATSHSEDYPYTSLNSFVQQPAYDRLVRVWSSSSGSMLSTLKGHSSGVVSVAWSPDGSKIATASYDGTARVWSSSSGSTLLTLTGHSGEYKWVYSVAWSPDGSKIATASEDRTARVWSSSSGSTLLTLTGHSGSVRSVAWSPDGSKIAAASGDGTARVWSSSSGSTLLTLTGHSGSVRSVAWSPDGSKIATASGDGTARVWSSSSGSTLLTLSTCIDPATRCGSFYNNGCCVHSVAWSPDGTKVTTASEDGAVRNYRICI